MVLVRSERPGRPLSSHDATASATVYVRDDLGARPSSSRSSALASTTAVEPVTLRRIRLPTASNPRLTEPSAYLSAELTSAWIAERHPDVRIWRDT